HRSLRGPAQHRWIPVQRHQPGGRAADHEPRARRDLRPDGHHQHGPRRDAHARLVHGVRRPGDLRGAVPGLRGLLFLRRAAARVPGRWCRRTGPRVGRHPVPLRPAARDPDRHVGCRHDPPAGRAALLRRSDERELADVVPGRRGGAHGIDLPVEPDLHRGARARGARRALVPPVAPHRALRAAGARRDGDRVTAPVRPWDRELVRVGLFGAVFAVGLPTANGLGFVSDYYLNLFGKYLALAILALGMDLIWGYTGILSLGQAIFFGIGAYSIGMHMMLESSGKGVYGEPVPDFMIWNQVYALPLFW